MNKESHCFMQLGPPDPLKECMSQFLDTKIASQWFYIVLFNRKLTKCTTLVDHNLAHSIRISVCNKGTPEWCVTQNCRSLDRAMCKRQAILLLQIIYYAVNKCSRNYGSTNTVLYAPVWYSADSWVATPREALLMLK